MGGGGAAKGMLVVVALGVASLDCDILPGICPGGGGEVTRSVDALEDEAVCCRIRVEGGAAARLVGRTAPDGPTNCVALGFADPDGGGALFPR